MGFDELHPLKKRENACASQVCRRVSSLESDLVPMTAIPAKLPCSQSRPYLLQYEELLIAIGQMLLGYCH
jgi:hypothetical protein